MSEHEDLSKAMGHWNASESYQLNAASVIVSVVFSLIFLLGTVGNSLVLAVLLRSGQLSYNTTNLFILNLSVADFFFIIFCVPFQATIYSLEGWVFGSFMCKVVHFFINLTMYASSFTLAAVSVDRCVLFACSLLALLIALLLFPLCVGKAIILTVLYLVRKTVLVAVEA